MKKRYPSRHPEGSLEYAWDQFRWELCFVLLDLANRVRPN